MVSLYEMRAMSEIVKFSMVEGEGGHDELEGGEEGAVVSPASPTAVVPEPVEAGGTKHTLPSSDPLCLYIHLYLIVCLYIHLYHAGQFRKTVTPFS